MLVLKTDKGIRRFCSYCKAPMAVTKETEQIFAARCPLRTGGEADRHDSVLKYTNTEALNRYALELFSRKQGA